MSPRTRCARSPRCSLSAHLWRSPDSQARAAIATNRLNCTSGGKGSLGPAGPWLGGHGGHSVRMPSRQAPRHGSGEAEGSQPVPGHIESCRAPLAQRRDCRISVLHSDPRTQVAARAASRSPSRGSCTCARCSLRHGPSCQPARIRSQPQRAECTLACARARRADTSAANSPKLSTPGPARQTELHPAASSSWQGTLLSTWC